MRILIDTDGKISLEESDDFKSFSIIDKTNNTNRAALEAIASTEEDNHYWIDARSIIHLSEKGNEPRWVEQFWNMLKAVEPYGFSNMEKSLVKAHVE